MEWRDRNGNDDSLTGYLSVSSYCKGVCQRHKVDVDVKRNVLPGDVVGPIKERVGFDVYHLVDKATMSLLGHPNQVAVLADFIYQDSAIHFRLPVES
ncbi:hypothetical protein TNIN_206421 [Trichonephila inaurata madagascariensis]|uniref:Uncharacterized protein n=1 Tax=Trichonephila inaurata madagascariensis TaxID=2747483 RepID=A0A8X6JNJ2_9ARAC|nr:hypothetical protein TNIN_206421 [Trichonephila inaurata madagascariensis]